MLQIIPSFLYTFKNFPCLFFCDKSNQLGKRKVKILKGLFAKPEADQNHFGSI